MPQYSFSEKVYHAACGAVIGAALGILVTIPLYHSFKGDYKSSPRLEELSQNPDVKEYIKLVNEKHTAANNHETVALGGPMALGALTGVGVGFVRSRKTKS